MVQQKSLSGELRSVAMSRNVQNLQQHMYSIVAASQSRACAVLYVYSYMPYGAQMAIHGVIIFVKIG
jgi:hypothetical protein